ncbi:MAG: epoxyqueuosine reductase QueH [Candidatus Brocadiae bacterium]|nr:epoxyqueuosine reductase QueH [Candidatus Brocadiia bacterium]
MRILLHICCAPCSIGPYEQLAGRRHDVTGYFYNPNIHPLIEFRRRKKALKVLQERMPISAVYEEDYGLMDYLAAVRWSSSDRSERCADCYRLRLARTAQEAARRGFEAISTTLLGSSRQDHALIKLIGEECARESGLRFFHADWRPLAEGAHQRAKEMGLYLQNYCGCIFSEWERFRDTARHVYRGPGPAVPCEEPLEPPTPC